MPEMLKLKDVAAALKVTIPTLYNLAKRGKLHFVKIGAATRINKDEINRFLAEGAK
jgi:excisionase family DNA binding protein